ncbi:Ribosome association toxin PasT (RatA) of the RatAB toxin-antitoxin module [Streptomyces sp. yr375]|uniref:type II toxin-antitoxin system RatA family toxin n=1 Tax=Streptomyces sp. yr375 TaxID=1761906 RepID=UPI0008CD4670|nr:SRPBCC family protein [Streptomyces sp. yr375]SER48075.1 Ribosome association toxin PasT (RatA) of the RatAB toxin-antitoxin module [Streptomyces sp. yr375]
MRYVRMAGTVHRRKADEIYPVVCDFARYPELTDAVRSVEILDLGGGRTGCAWEVTFRRGILKWTEEDRYDKENHRVDFSLLAGDLDRLVGHWRVEDVGEDCRVHFSCDFDMGIPTLADVIEPIAEHTLRDYIAVILGALVDGIVLDEDALLVQDGARS